MPPADRHPRCYWLFQLINFQGTTGAKATIRTGRYVSFLQYSRVQPSMIPAGPFEQGERFCYPFSMSPFFSLPSTQQPLCWDNNFPFGGVASIYPSIIGARHDQSGPAYRFISSICLTLFEYRKKAVRPSVMRKFLGCPAPPMGTFLCQQTHAMYMLYCVVHASPMRGFRSFHGRLTTCYICLAMTCRLVYSNSCWHGSNFYMYPLESHWKRPETPRWYPTKHPPHHPAKVVATIMGILEP